jgi:hypothetical protein
MECYEFDYLGLQWLSMLSSLGGPSGGPMQHILPSFRWRSASGLSRSLQCPRKAPWWGDNLQYIPATGMGHYTRQKSNEGGSHGRVAS